MEQSEAMAGRPTGVEGAAATALLAREDVGRFVKLGLVEEGVAVVDHAMHGLVREAVVCGLAAGRHVVIVMPPEMGKSSQMRKVLVWLVGHNPSLRVGLISRDAGLAKKNLIAIRKTLLGGVVAAVFPDLKPDLGRSMRAGEWSMERVYLTGEHDPCFEANSLDASGEGSRYDLVWIDDAVTRKCHRSEAERELVESAIHNTWLRRVTRGGIAVVTNNKWHRDDSISRMYQSESFFCLEIGCDGTERLYWRAHHAPSGWSHGVGGTMRLWAVWPKERLAGVWAENRAAFKRLYEQKSVVREDMRFPEAEGWATFGEGELPEPTEAYGLYGFLDPAGGKRTKREDFAALTTVLVSARGELFVPEVWIQRCAPELQVEACFLLYRAWRARGYTMTRLFVEMLAKDEMWLLPVFQRRAEELRAQGMADYDLPYAVVHPREHKNTRIERLIGHFERGWLKFPESFLDQAKSHCAVGESWARLIGQFEDFPFGDHDDGPDSLAGAVVAAMQGGAVLARLAGEAAELREYNRMLRDTNGEIKRLPSRADWGKSREQRLLTGGAAEKFERLAEAWTQ